MIQYLQRLKHKKGFTLVELAVVVGIIVVLTAIIMVNMIGGDTEKILAANSNAKVFFTASQLTLTRAELTERSIVDYQGNTAFIEYKNAPILLMENTCSWRLGSARTELYGFMLTTI